MSSLRSSMTARPSSVLIAAVGLDDRQLYASAAVGAITALLFVLVLEILRLRLGKKRDLQAAPDEIGDAGLPLALAKRRSREGSLYGTAHAAEQPNGIARSYTDPEQLEGPRMQLNANRTLDQPPPLR